MIWAGPKKITDLIIRKNCLFSAIMAIASKARYGTDDLRPYYNSVRRLFYLHPKYDNILTTNRHS